MDFTIEFEHIMAMAISVICGGCIGFEREYRNKSAGFRTIILITLGSTIFTIVSWHGAGTDDRISANIITGIGFIGAGVIFKDRISVRGLTTAAVIWTAAAIGMTAGIGYHALALVLTLVTIMILLTVSKVEKMVSGLRNEKLITITFSGAEMKVVEQLEADVRLTDAKIERMDMAKENGRLTVIYLITASKTAIDRVQEMLAVRSEIAGYA
ncbi:MgtC/SapB family protein [Pedobacter zeae]|nr:MgtC/SapB family protein [Pedobacter zeae]MBB4108363.1 putative Mg2+ transporter-C (MgtC) family protein [Pedobacter zeae]